MSVTTPPVSVILPVYNAEKTLRQAIDSILSQSYKNFEVIAVDDGSKDHSHQILQQYALQDSRLKVFQNSQNLGLMKTLNRAIGLAENEYLARFDSDDEMLPRRLELQVQYLQEHRDVAVVGAQYYFMGRQPSRDKLFQLPQTPEDIQAQILKENPLCHSAVMLRKSALLKVGGYRDFFVNSEDYDLWLRMSREFKLANLSEPLLRFRLSLGGAGIKRRREMQIYRELAIQSYLQPQKDLASLKKEIEIQFNQKVQKDYFFQFYWQLFKAFFSLGHYQESLKALLYYFKNWGSSA